MGVYEINVPNVYSIMQANALYAYCGNNPTIFIDTLGLSAEDIAVGAIAALDEGAFNDIVSWALDQLGKDIDLYSPDSNEDYYLGRMIGDVLCMAISAGEGAWGIMEILGSVVAGGAVTVGSGGTLTAGGITISVIGVTAGAVAVSGAISTTYKATQNFSDDFQNWKKYSQENVEPAQSTNPQGKKRVIVDKGNQDKHIKGTNNFNNLARQGKKEGILEADAQQLLDERAGTGTRINATKERVNFGRVIGQYYDYEIGAYVETTNGIIHYTADGRAHIVPARPNIKGV